MHPPNSTFETTQKPLSVMVWGAIGPKDFSTPLIKAEGNINTEKYVRMLVQNRIIAIIQTHFGRNYVWQQDNAPSHAAILTKKTLLKFLPEVLDWPPRSPDLSPIEHLLDYIKDRIGNATFKDENDLFNKIKYEWNNIPPEVIHNTYSSFLARCIVCHRNNGVSLSTLWKKVHIEGNICEIL